MDTDCVLQVIWSMIEKQCSQLVLFGAAYQLVVSVGVDGIYVTSHYPHSQSCKGYLVEVSRIPSMRGSPFYVVDTVCTRWYHRGIKNYKNCFTFLYLVCRICEECCRVVTCFRQGVVFWLDLYFQSMGPPRRMYKCYGMLYNIATTCEHLT